MFRTTKNKYTILLYFFIFVLQRKFVIAMEHSELTDHGLLNNTEKIVENDEIFSSFLEDLFAFNADLQIPRDINDYKVNYKNGFFSSTNIKMLPESISTLTKLTCLDLFFCPCLTELPKGIGKLTNLTKLFCVANEVKSLPNSFQYLTNLTELNLNNSLVTSLPLGFIELTKLENLMLFNTPLAKELNIAKDSHEAINPNELKIAKEYIRKCELSDAISNHEFVFDQD